MSAKKIATLCFEKKYKWYLKWFCMQKSEADCYKIKAKIYLILYNTIGAIYRD